jgi:isoleucyl-tRNA synthetase
MTDDKEAAYMTLYTVLRTVTLLTAPFCPFMTEAIYQNIVRSVDETAPMSVHLCNYPAADESFIDAELEDEMAKVLNIVTVGRSARSTAGMKTRQPLQKMYVQGEALSDRATTIAAEELNVKEVAFIENADALMSYKVKPQLRTLGPRYGKLLGKISAHLAANGDAIVLQHHAGQNYTFTVDGTEVVLSADDVLVSTQQKEGLVSEQGNGVTVVLDTNLTPELREEGLMRELVSKLQTMRKEAGFEVADHIRIGYVNGGEAARVLVKFAESVKADTLAERIEEGAFGYTKDWDLNGNAITLSVERI